MNTHAVARSPGYPDAAYPIVQSAKLFNAQAGPMASRSYLQNRHLNHRNAQRRNSSGGSRSSYQDGKSSREHQVALPTSGSFSNKSRSSAQVGFRPAQAERSKACRSVSPHVHQSIKAPQNQKQLQQQQLEKVLQQLHLPRHQTKIVNPEPNGYPARHGNLGNWQETD